jgi:hypothetical protein
MNHIVKKGSVSGLLYRLIYCSRIIPDRGGDGIVDNNAPEVSVAGALEAELRAILATARRRITADEVTGALLFTAAGFAQVLEGQREVVERTFDRISADPRHADVKVLSFTPTERRSFPDWPMGFYGQTTPGAVDPLSGLFPDPAYSGPRITTGSDVLRLLERLVQQEDQWIAA